MVKSRMNYAIVADCETGGLPNAKKAAFEDIALTEIAFVVIDLKSLQIVEKKSWLFEYQYKDNLEYTVEALNSTNISIELLKEQGLPLKEIYRDMKRLLGKYTKGVTSKPVIVGHNIYKFDRPFFENFFSYMSDNFDSYVSGYEDTLIWSGLKFLESTNYKLGTIAQTLGVELINAHRALDDTVANAEVFISMLKSLRDSAEGIEENVFKKKFKIDVKYEF